MYSNNIIMAFDFGIKSIGVAIGQNITYTANPLKSIKANNGIPDWKIIKNLFNEWSPKIIIVGLPLNIKGMEQPITIKARKFAFLINNLFGIKVILYDERFSTIEARSFLFEKGKYRALIKSKIDSQSAVIILESWLHKMYKKNYN